MTNPGPRPATASIQTLRDEPPIVGRKCTNGERGNERAKRNESGGAARQSADLPHVRDLH